MADGHDVEHVGGVVDREDDAVVADAKTSECKPSLKFLDAHGSRVVFEGFEPVDDPVADRVGERLDFAAGGAGKSDGITSHRSAERPSDRAFS